MKVKKIMGVIVSAFLVAENRFFVSANTSDRIVIFIAVAIALSIINYYNDLCSEQRRKERWNYAARCTINGTNHPSNAKQ